MAILHLLLNLVVLLSSNVENVDCSSTEEKNVVGKGSDLSSQLDGRNEDQSSGSSGLGRIWGKGLDEK